MRHLQRMSPARNAAAATTGQWLQRHGNGGPMPSAVLRSVAEVLRGPGQPLAADVRGFAEPRLGHDFSGVRVHADDAAARSARDVNALAYTVGQDVVFGAGQYRAGDAAGRHLIAHELAHVVQQSRGGATSPQDRTLEAEAEAAADVMQAGGRANIEGAGALGIARAPKRKAFTASENIEQQAQQASQNNQAGQMDRDERGNEVDEEANDEDEDWTPQGVATKRMRMAREGEPQYPLETLAFQWQGDSHQVDAGSGPIRYHRGRGGQPYVRTNRNNYGGAKVGSDYDSIVTALSHENSEIEEKRAFAMLQMSRGERYDVSRESNEVRRAMSFLLGMTQIAEEAGRRTPGSASVARACLTNIAEGVSNFHTEFNRTDGRFIAARHGGTAEMRLVGRGERELDDDVAGNMSEYEDL